MTNRTFIVVIIVIYLSILSHHRTISSAPLTKDQIILSNVEKFDTILNPNDFSYQQTEPISHEDELQRLGFQIKEDPVQQNLDGKFEGDIYIPGNKTIQNFINDSNDVSRAAVRDQWRKWPNSEIPYLISSEYGSYSRRMIARAFDEYHQKSCIKFVPRNQDKHSDYIFIHPDDGCYSFVGRTGGRQPVSLDGGCMQLGTIVHELMHSTGFFHEQSRSDRDDYVEVIWPNIRSNSIDQFEKYSLRTITQLDLPYDYGSIMHYGPRTFSKNGDDTLRALKPSKTKIGQRGGFSSLDLKKLNKLYNCPDYDYHDVSESDTTNSNSRSIMVNFRPTCKNYKWHCFFWQWLGYCKKDKQYMLQYCPEKCDFCDEFRLSFAQNRNMRQLFSTVHSEIAATTSPIIKNCTDFHSHCPAWRKMGYCEKTEFEEHVVKTCPFSCERCGGGTETTKIGDSAKFKEENENFLQSIIGDRCQNRIDDRTCDQYAFWGMCTEKKMSEVCKKACNLC